MDKEKIIEILEDYEFFVDDDFGGHYEHINCSQKALTPFGIVEILDYISELEQQVKKQKEVIDKTINELFILKDMIYKPEMREENFEIQRKISSLIKRLKDKEV